MKPEAEDDQESELDRGRHVPETAAVSGKEQDEELQTRYLRLAADFQNFKRRTEKEKGDIYAYANEKLMTEMLDVIDSLERAVAADAARRNDLGRDEYDPETIEGGIGKKRTGRNEGRRGSLRSDLSSCSFGGTGGKPRKRTDHFSITKGVSTE